MFYRKGHSLSNMNNQINLLRTHFSETEIQTLLDIFPYLRDPSYREIGFQLLKGADLYDSFHHFITRYAINHQLYWKNNADLWDYMFAFKLELTDNVPLHTSILYKNEEICLPLFSGGLELEINDWYRGMYLPQKEDHIVISNVLDIDYPISLTYNLMNSIDMPPTVNNLHLLGVSSYYFSNELYIRNFKKYPPNRIKTLVIDIPFNLKIGDTLKNFDELESLDMSPTQFLNGMDTMVFPTNLKTLIVNCPTEDKMGKFQIMLRNCISNCPHLTTIQIINGRSFDCVCFPLWGEIVQFLESKMYKAIDMNNIEFVKH